MADNRNTRKRTLVSALRIAAVAAIGALAGFGGVLAYYGDTASLVNSLSTAASGVAMVEEFNPSAYFIPGEEVTKVVQFKNTGNADLFLRIEVPAEERWLDADGTAADELEPSKVIKGWTDAWTDTEQEINGVQEKLQIGVDTEGLTPDLWGETDLWSIAYKDDSGRYWRYYKKVLQPGELTDPIMTYIKLDPMASTDRHSPDYSDKIYKLTFNAQAVQTEWREGATNGENLAASSEWKMHITSTTTGADGSVWLTWAPES